MNEYRYWIKDTYDYNFIDLFCGSGGLSLGFERSGFRCELAVDFDESCVNTYKHNHPDIDSSKILNDDISNQTKKSWPNFKSLKNKIDVICGGPPCQGFSTANRQRLINDPRNYLYKEFIHTVNFFKPKITLMENVSGIYNKREDIFKDFNAIGYQGICIKLNAEDFKIPQRRRRVFFIMFNKDAFTDIDAVKSKVSELIENQKSKSKFKLKDAINDLPKLKAKTVKNNTQLENKSFGFTEAKINSKGTDYTRFINGNDGAYSTLYNHKTRYNNDRDIKIFSLLKQGEDSTSDSIAKINPYKNREKIFKDKYFKLKANDVSKTITAHMKFDCNMYIHPKQARGLTPREAARIQTYPDSYQFMGPYTKWYMQIGNSVPPVLAHVISSSIKKVLDEQKVIKCFDLFSGIGGFRQGVDSAMKSLNLKSKWVGRADIDPYANKLYDHVHDVNSETLIDDITAVTGSLMADSKDNNEAIKQINLKLPDFDLLTGGFPCQAFSSMGKRKGLRDPRGTMFYAIELILKAKKPKHFILENVRGLLTIDSRKTIQTMRSILEDLGYTTAIWLLNASDYGLPQTRRRVFIVGSKLNKTLSDDKAPEKVTFRKYPHTWHLLDKDVDEKYYLSEKIKKTILSEGTGGYKYKADYNLLTARPLTFTMHKMHRASQDNYFSDSFINGEYDEENGKVIETRKGKKRIRRITPKEAFLLQGFSKDFVKKALSSGLSDTRLYMLAGNAVPTNVVKAVTSHFFSVNTKHN